MKRYKLAQSSGGTWHIYRCICNEIRDARAAKKLAADTKAHARVVLQGAIYAGFGCIDLRKVSGWSSASEQMANLVLKELCRNGFCITEVSK